MSDTDDNSDVMQDWAEALDEASQADQTNQTDDTNERSDIAPADFQELKDESSTIGDDVNIDVILDIPVIVSMEIGRTHINIRNLLQLNQGSVIELDRLAGEPLDVLVNGTLIAHGEVVVVNEKFGIRLTDVISPTERVKKLR